MWIYILGGLFVIFAICSAIFTAVFWWSTPKRHRMNIRGKNVFITGGSKGIGRELAAEFLRRGANSVSIAARSVSALAAAKEYLDTIAKEGQRVETYEMDVTWEYEKIADLMQTAEDRVGSIDVLVNNAGFVVQGAFDEIPIESFTQQMQINYVSGALVTRAGMKARRRGHICFVSSAAGQCAIWGYSAYSPSKFAVRALADVLHMELQPFGIGVSVVYPPNTDTEGFAVEQKEMPEQIREISGTSGIFSADHVARATVDTIERGGFRTTIGFEGWMLGVLTAGASPEPIGYAAYLQFLLAGLFRGVMIFYLGAFDRIVQVIHDKCEDSARHRTRSR
ncbi:3-ketodihydrosphingosine reductase [Aphelenchoides fujianensis]|nr:3-ketodihydrosphingosine reductase [Aphelenchoides fujianensis]